MELWFATGNPGKVKELERLFVDHKIDIKSIKDLSTYATPEETGKTFEENARIKAKALKAIKSDSWVLAEDSGLVVPGLNNFPGVHSARYAGPNARDIENVAKVLKMMGLRSNDQREAHFEASMCLISPEGDEAVFTGKMEGEIAKDMRGSNGFGYDPIFIPQGETQTLAELGTAAKNKISHRAQAAKQLLTFLKDKANLL